MASRDQDFTR